MISAVLRHPTSCRSRAALIRELEQWPHREGGDPILLGPTRFRSPHMLLHGGADSLVRLRSLSSPDVTRNRGCVELGPLASRRPASCRCARTRASCSPRWGAERPDPGRHRPRLQPTISAPSRAQIVFKDGHPSSRLAPCRVPTRARWCSVHAERPSSGGLEVRSGGLLDPRGTAPRNAWLRERA